MKLELRNLSIGYKNDIILSGLTTCYDSGQLVCLTGDNGSGKSTLLRTISGLLPPLYGEILIDGHPLSSLHPQLSKLISIVNTSPINAQDLTVHDVVAMGRSPYTGLFGNLSDEDKHIIDEVLTLIGMLDFSDRKIGSMSDGEVQKVMIAKCLAQQTPILLMDEPTAFLDYKSKKCFYSLLRDLVENHQKLIIFSSHDLPLALEYATIEQSI